MDNGRNPEGWDRLFSYDPQDRKGGEYTRQGKQHDELHRVYPIHHRLQRHCDIMQGLFSSATDLSLNTKIPDLTDSEIRAIPIRFMGISSSYIGGLCLSCMIFFVLACLSAYELIPIATAHLVAFAFAAFLVLLGGWIFYSMQRYIFVGGKKTTAYFRKATSGWRLFEFSMLLVWGGSLIAYLALRNYSFNTLLNGISHPLFKKMHEINLEPLGIIPFHFFLFTSLVFISYIFVATLSSMRAVSESKKNTMLLKIEHNREEVADEILGKR